MNEIAPISVEKELIPFAPKRKRSILPLFALALLGIGILLIAKFGVFSALKARFDEKPSTAAPSLYDFDRTRLSGGASAILPVDLSAKKAGMAFSEPLPLSVDELPPFPFAEGGKRTVLVINTHPFEGYSPEGAFEYTDATALVGGEMTVRLCAEALVEALTECGIPAFYVENPAVSLRDSYKNAAALLTDALATYGDTALVVDLHRAVLLAENGDLYRPVTQIDGKTAAQMRLIVPTGDADESAIRSRLSAALTLSRAVNTECDTLMMPISLSSDRHGLSLDLPVITAELGSCGNSAAEGIHTAELLGKALAALLGA